MDILEKRPWIMIVLGVLGVSLSSIFVKYSTAPSGVTAAWRLLWTVVLMTPAVFGKASVRRELFTMGRKLLLLSILSGLFLAAHFATWFESLQHTSVASSTTIVSTEVIWVSLGWWLVLKGKLSGKAVGAIAVTFLGSVLIALADRGSAGHLKGDLLALAAAVAVAVYVLIGRVARQTLSTSVYTYTVYSACALAPGAPVRSAGPEPLRLRLEPRDRGSAPFCVLHLAGPQHLLLVPEIFLPGLCVRLQAL